MYKEKNIFYGFLFLLGAVWRSVVSSVLGNFNSRLHPDSGYDGSCQHSSSHLPRTDFLLCYLTINFWTTDSQLNPNWILQTVRRGVWYLILDKAWCWLSPYYFPCELRFHLAALLLLVGKVLEQPPFLPSVHFLLNDKQTFWPVLDNSLVCCLSSVTD